MGRQFQLETIPRFQWRVIVEVCSGLAQTKLDSTNFWVTECDVRFGVKSAVLTVGQSLPIYPDKQTFSESDGMSQMCPQADIALIRSRAPHIGYTWICRRTGEFDRTTFSRLPFGKFALCLS